ncbi:MAG: TRAP transporter fused permease subunit [Acidobacteriota bacterium]|nr:TRAP transporter fused permease subunit [Acidobacteriota bacterium]
MRKNLIAGLGALLSIYTLVEVNYPLLTPHSELATFAMFGLVICFLHFPLHAGLAENTLVRGLDWVLATLTIAACGYVIVQSEPTFEGVWSAGMSLGDRAGQETGLDFAIGLIGLMLVLEATRRSIGWILPILATIFLIYAYAGPYLPDALFPHRGYDLERIVGQTFLHSQGVFSTALKVMFTYVYLFVIFGSFLKFTGATQYIVDFAERAFGKSAGGPAKVSVLASGLMGSLSGSAVANTATTGTFTIPMMTNSGFRPHIAGGVVAAASSGGALVPPVMGAGAYMMLEIIDPPVTFVQIMRAAIVPAALYYLALLLIVDFYARRSGAVVPEIKAEKEKASLVQFEGLVFFAALGSLIAFLIIGYSPFRSVTLSLVVSLVLAAFNGRTRVSLAKGFRALADASLNGISLVAAAASVGVVLGIVTLTGLGTKFPSAILELSQSNLLLALILIMLSSIVLGMGLPSAVCYLLMATLIGPVLGQLGVVPLAAHLFIFYFGMMSMVTPPVALAAYTASSIAKSGLMTTGLAAFRFALVGFTLPFMFVFRPGLLLMTDAGEPAPILVVAPTILIAILGIVPLAAGIAGYLFSDLNTLWRGLSLVTAALLLYPGRDFAVAGVDLAIANLVGLALLAAVAAFSWVHRNPGRATT